MAGDAEEKTGGLTGPSIETQRAERNIWLLKVPNAVAYHWKQPPPILGKLILSLDPMGDPDDPNTTQFTMDVSAKDPDAPPKSYDLNFTKDVVPMHIFSETSQGKIAVEGKVEHKFDMKPTSLGDEEYRKLCRERLNKSLVKSRTLQRLENDRGSFMRPMPMAMWSSTGAKDKKKPIPPPKQPEGKRIRRERNELEDIVFKLFERQPNWTLKQLVQETDQPVAFLKEVLNDLCIYNKRGANQGTYELKPEYKRTGQDEQGADVKDSSAKS
ncbi:transcription initiation factor TFIIF subunit beta [Marchantia polymorpha subsp. ruderalis]|uniref:Uncharacterized protein n=2 Tax=Marchantia polymorpha TaxID=3197 RepID=A0A176WPF7_MARPO|nr:hypothetical protein AXG93_1593s1410 [Marchantia polymorpha subsp. ruderalis]PTQ44748.1 hypothetical protein MARPO_0019s0153 [Marchantia polymorpha]BBM98477.1 hypothetical protein Mp_1g13830 [Marchantia polymorpha subsp. ruderalis]|eukprot:PTQ44748.1 hypothetical protein MARPO_0019s0153 [Marchantia polymorpha]